MALSKAVLMAVDCCGVISSNHTGSSASQSGNGQPLESMAALISWFCATICFALSKPAAWMKASIFSRSAGLADFHYTQTPKPEMLPPLPMIKVFLNYNNSQFIVKY